VNKKDAQRAERDTSSRTIADLERAIEELVSRSKKPQELEGITAAAKELAQEWRIKEPGGRKRPLFGNIANDTTFLLAGLVVALRPFQRRLEQIRRYFPPELESLVSASSFAEFRAFASTLSGATPKPTPTQKYEWKRRRWHRSFFNSIEYQFGSSSAFCHPGEPRER
jgi:hypothetical protein